MKAPCRVRICIFLYGVLFFLAVVPLLPSTRSSARSHGPQPYSQEFTIPSDGAALYRQKCSSCHDTARDYTPAKSVLERRGPDEIISALTTGSMKQQAAGLNAQEIRAVAIYLTGRQPGTSGATVTPLKQCDTNGSHINFAGPQWNGWGRDLDNSRYQPAPGLKPEDVSRLKVKWSFAYQGGRTNSQPSIIGDRLYVSSAPGLVYCINAKTGCAYWTYDPGAGVRAAISTGRLPGPPARVVTWFGDTRSFVHAVDAATGAPLWKTQIETHPVSRVTGAPVFYQGRLYVPLSSVEEGAGRNDKYECCTFRGSLVALDAHTGKIIWKSHSIPEPLRPYKKSSVGTQMHGPAGGAIWSAPTIDPKRKLVYAATGDSYTEVETKGADAIIAFDLETGKIKWINQVTPNDNFLVGCNGPNPPANCPQPLGPDFDFGSSPILRTLGNGKQVILAGQKSGVIYALDPDDSGKILWKVQLGHGATLGGIQWGPAADQQNVYVAISDVNAPTDKRRPGLTALRIATGEQVWHTPAPKSDCSQEGRGCSNAQSAAVTLIPGIVFSGSIDGHLRAYSIKDGSIVWDFNTAANTYETVNGSKVRGGALNATGPVIVDGVLYVNSGYGGISGQSGNVLLAFTVDGK